MRLPTLHHSIRQHLNNLLSLLHKNTQQIHILIFPQPHPSPLQPKLLILLSIELLLLLIFLRHILQGRQRRAQHFLILNLSLEDIHDALSQDIQPIVDLLNLRHHQLRIIFDLDQVRSHPLLPVPIQQELKLDQLAVRVTFYDGRKKHQSAQIYYFDHFVE